MDLTWLTESKLLLAVLAGFGGILATLLTQQLLNRRSLLTYYAQHMRVGMSADDKIYGNVRVTWNESPVANLFLSTIHLRNASNRDLTDVKVIAFSNDADLLTENAALLDTTQLLHYTTDFESRLQVPPGEQPTDEQFRLYRARREYSLPTFNRGQAIRMQFLAAAHEATGPSIWLDIVHPGVRLQYRDVPPEFLGAPKQPATYVGLSITAIAVVMLVSASDNTWLVGLCSFVLGLMFMVPGALAIRAWRQVQTWLAG